MQKAISFEATAIAKYIYQNNTSAKKERPQETSYFSIFLDIQQNKNCSKVLSRHGTELWMADFLIISFLEPSVMLTTHSKKWQIFRSIWVLIKFDHIWNVSKRMRINIERSICEKMVLVGTDVVKYRHGILYKSSASVDIRGTIFCKMVWFSTFQPH